MKNNAAIPSLRHRLGISQRGCTFWRGAALGAAVTAQLLSGCGNKDRTETTASSGGGTAAAQTRSPSTPPSLPANLPNALLIAYAQFEVENGAVTARPGPARLEILRRRAGEWRVDAIEDSDSRVFHKAMVFTPRGASPGILTLGGSPPCEGEGNARRNCRAHLKLWRRSGEQWSANTLWQEDFGGRFNRMRDAEVGDLFGDGRPAIAVATHDQGVVGVIRGSGDRFEVEEIDRESNRFVHEIELGDLDSDDVIEVYATPSEPNTLEGAPQRGVVVRYIPGAEGDERGRRVVADLGTRHAKEILVDDVDGDGTDELYVAVEALMTGEGATQTIAEPVEIRRYDANTPADGGVVIATIPDRLTRFLTVGDLDGDGKKEMVAAAFRSGIWLLRPGRNPREEWSSESVDRDSSGFEHAALAADLDGDGTDELYVAADEQGELRRYVWNRGRLRRETIHSRPQPRSRMTWNLMPVPVGVLDAR